MGPDAALALCRFLHDASAMLLWGASAYLWALVPSKLAEDVGRRQRLFVVVSIVVAVATTTVSFPLQTATLGDGWSDAFSLTIARDILFDTSVGIAWQVQAVTAAFLAATLAVPPRRRRPATVLASGLVLVSLTFSGHAAMQQGWIGIAHRINDAVHVLSGGGWLGALVPLVAILGRLGSAEAGSEAGIALRRFSTAGHDVVALVVASGVVNTILVLGSWPTDGSSPYQAMLAAKIALVAMMVGLATVNRYTLAPGIASLRSNAVRAMRRATFAEIALRLGVVALVAVFGMLDPA